MSDQILRSITIPSRPAVLDKLQRELEKDNVNLQVVANLISSDVALSIAVLSSVNSAAFGFSRKIESISQAINLLGVKPLNNLVTAACLRNSLNFKGVSLDRFWDASNKRARVMVRLARGIRSVDPNLAQAMGLFCDVGIPLLMQRFPDYVETLKIANGSMDKSFTEIEYERHGIHHAKLGSMMARAWGFNDVLVASILHHHNYDVFTDAQVPEAVAQLVAMMLLCEISIQRYSRLNITNEWQKSHDRVAGALMFSDADIDDWIGVLTDELADL